MRQSLRCGALLALAFSLEGCSTLQGDFHQKIQIDALDEHNRPIEGMPCHISSGDSAKEIVTPAQDVRVRRAMTPLSVECRIGQQVATATVKSRREGLEEALLPFVGSATVFIDHLSGSLYAYPSAVHLRVGQHLVLAHGSEAKVVSSEPVGRPPDAKPAVVPAPVEVAALQPRSTPAAQPAVAAAQKTRAASSVKSGSAVKSVKTASSAGAKPRTPAASVASAPAGSVASTLAPSAPVNW